MSEPPPYPARQSAPQPTPPPPYPARQPTPNDYVGQQQAWDAAWGQAKWVDDRVQKLRDVAENFRGFGRDLELLIKEANDHVAHDPKNWKGDGKEAFVKQWNFNIGGQETAGGSAPQVLWALKTMSNDTADAIDKLAQAVGSYIYTMKQIDDIDKAVSTAFIIIGVAGLIWGLIGSSIAEIGLEVGLQAARALAWDILKEAMAAVVKSLTTSALKQMIFTALRSAIVAGATDIGIQLIKQEIWYVDYTAPTGRTVPADHQFNVAEVIESGATMAFTEGLLHVASPAVNTIIGGTRIGQSKWLSQFISHVFAGLTGGGADAMVQGLRGGDWNWQEFWTNTAFGITMHLHDGQVGLPGDTLVIHGPGDRTYQLNLHGDDMRFVDPSTGKEIGNAIFDNSYQNEPRIHVTFDDPAQVWTDRSGAGSFDFGLNGTNIDVTTHGVQQVGIQNAETGRVQQQKIMTETNATYDVGHDGTISRTGQTETFADGRIRAVDGNGHVVENQFLLGEPLRVDPGTGAVLAGPHIPGEILLPRETTVAFDAQGDVTHAMTPGWDGQHATLYGFGDDGRFQPIGDAHRGPDGKVVIETAGHGDPTPIPTDAEGRALFEVTQNATNIRLAVPDTTKFEPVRVTPEGMLGKPPADPSTARSILPRLIDGAHSGGLRPGIDAIAAGRLGEDGHFVLDLPGAGHHVEVEVRFDPATGDVRLRLSAGDLSGMDQAAVTRAVETALHELADAAGRPLHVATGDILGLRGDRADLVFHASGERPAAVYHLLESVAASIEPGGGGRRVTVDVGDDLRIEFTTDVEGAGTRQETIRLTDVGVWRGGDPLEPRDAAKVLEPALQEVAELTARPVELVVDPANTMVVRPSDTSVAGTRYTSIDFSPLKTGAPPELPKARPAGSPLADGTTRQPGLPITVRHGAGYERVYLTGKIENGELHATLTGDIADVAAALDRPELRGAVVAGVEAEITRIADMLGVPVRLDAGALAAHLPKRVFEPVEAPRTTAEPPRPATTPVVKRTEVKAYMAAHGNDAGFSLVFPVEHMGVIAYVKAIGEVDVATGELHVELVRGDNAEALGAEIPRDVVIAQVEEALHGIAEPAGTVHVYGGLDLLRGPEADKPVIEANTEEPVVQRPAPDEMPKKAPREEEVVKAQESEFDQIQQPIEQEREQAHLRAGGQEPVAASAVPETPDAVPPSTPGGEPPPAPPGGVPPSTPNGDVPPSRPDWQRDLAEGLTAPGASEVLVTAEFHHDGRVDAVTFSAAVDPETGEVVVALSAGDTPGQIHAAGGELSTTVEEGLQALSTTLDRPVVVSAHSLPGESMGLDGRVYHPEPDGGAVEPVAVPPEPGGGKRPPEQPASERSRTPEPEPVKAPEKPEPRSRSVKAPVGPDVIELDHWVAEHGKPLQYMGKVKRYPVGASAEQPSPHTTPPEPHTTPPEPHTGPGEQRHTPSAERPGGAGEQLGSIEDLTARIGRQRSELENTAVRLERIKTEPIKQIKDALDFGRRLNETYKQHLDLAKEKLAAFESRARRRPDTGPLGWADALRARQDALNRLTREATGRLHDVSVLDRVTARARREVTLSTELTDGVKGLLGEFQADLPEDQQRLADGVRETVVDALKVHEYVTRRGLEHLVKGELGELRVDETVSVPWAERPVQKLRSQIAALDDELRAARDSGDRARATSVEAKLQRRLVKLDKALKRMQNERVAMKIHELMTQSRDAGVDDYRGNRAAGLTAAEQRVRDLRSEIGGIDDELGAARGDEARTTPLTVRRQEKLTELATALTERERLDRAERRYLQHNPVMLPVEAGVMRARIVGIEKGLAEALRRGDRTMAVSLMDDLGRSTDHLRWVETRRGIGDLRSHLDDIGARLETARSSGDAAAVTRLETRLQELREALDSLVSTPRETRAVEEALSRVAGIDTELRDAEADHASAYDAALDRGDAARANELSQEIQDRRDLLNGRREQALRRLVTKLWKLRDEDVVPLDADLLRVAARGDEAALGTLVEEVRSAGDPASTLREAGVRGPVKEVTHAGPRRRDTWAAEDLLAEETDARPAITTLRDAVADLADRRPLRNDDAVAVANLHVENHFAPIEEERTKLEWQRQQRQAYVKVLERTVREEERLAELTATEPAAGPALRAQTERVAGLHTALDNWTESGADALPARTTLDGTELHSSYVAENLEVRGGIFGRHVADGSGDPRSWKDVTTTEVDVPVKPTVHTTHREVLKDWLTGKQPSPDPVNGLLPVETKTLHGRYDVVTLDGVKLRVDVYHHNSLVIDSGLRGLSMLRLDSGLGDGILPWWHMTPWGHAVELGPLTLQFVLPIGPNIDLQYLPGLRRDFYSYDQVGRETIVVKKLSDPNGSGLPDSWTYETPATELKLASPVVKTEQFYTKGGVQLAAFPLVQFAPTIPGMDPMTRPPFFKTGIVILGQLTWEISAQFDSVTLKPVKLPDRNIGAEVLVGNFFSFPGKLGNVRFMPDMRDFWNWDPAPGTVGGNRVVTYALGKYIEHYVGKLLERTGLNGGIEEHAKAQALTGKTEQDALTAEQERIRGLLADLTGPSRPGVVSPDAVSPPHEPGRPGSGDTYQVAAGTNVPHRRPNVTRKLSEDMLVRDEHGNLAYSLKTGEGHPAAIVEPTTPKRSVTPAKLDFTERAHQQAALIDHTKVSVLGDRDLATGAKIVRPATPGGFHLTSAELEMYARQLIGRMYDTEHYPGEGGALIVQLATADKPAQVAILDNPASTAIVPPEGWVVVMHYRPYGHEPGGVPSSGDVLFARGTPLEYVYVIHHASTDPADRAMILRVTREAPADRRNWPNDPINDLKSPPVPMEYSDALVARQAELDTRSRVDYADIVDEIEDLLTAPPHTIPPEAVRTLFPQLLSGAAEVAEHAPGAVQDTGLLHNRLIARVRATLEHAVGSLKNRPEHADLARSLKAHLDEWDDVEFAIEGAYTDRLKPAHQFVPPLSAEDAARVAGLHDDLTRWHDVLTAEAAVPPGGPSTSGLSVAGPDTARTDWTTPMHKRDGEGVVPGEDPLRTRPVAETDFFALGDWYAPQLTDPYLKARYETLLARLRLIESEHARTGADEPYDLAMAAWHEAASGLEQVLGSPVARFHERYAPALAAEPALRARLSDLHQEYEAIYAAYGDSPQARADALLAWRAKADALSGELDPRPGGHETPSVAIGHDPGGPQARVSLGERAKADFVRLESRRSAELHDPLLRARYDALLHDLADIEKRYDLSAYAGQRAGGFGKAMTSWRRSAALLEEMLDSPIARHWDWYGTILNASPKMRGRFVSLHDEYERLLHALPGRLLRRDHATMNGMHQLRWHADVRMLTADLELQKSRSVRSRWALMLNALWSRAPHALPRGPVTRRLSLTELGLPGELDLTPRRHIPVVAGVETGRNPTKLATWDLSSPDPLSGRTVRDPLTGWTELTQEEREGLLLGINGGMTNGRGLEYGGQLSPTNPAEGGHPKLALAEGGPQSINRLEGFRLMIHSHPYGHATADIVSTGDFLALIGHPYSHEYVLEHATPNGLDRPRLLRYDRDSTFREVLPSEMVAPRLPDEFLPLVERAHLLKPHLNAEQVTYATLMEQNKIIHGLDHPVRLSRAETALDYVDRLLDRGYAPWLIRKAIQQDRIALTNDSQASGLQHDWIKNWTIRTLIDTTADLPHTPQGDMVYREMRDLVAQGDQLEAILDGLREGKDLSPAETTLAERLRESLRIAHDWWLTGRLDEDGAS